MNEEIEQRGLDALMHVGLPFHKAQANSHRYLSNRPPSFSFAIQNATNKYARLLNKKQSSRVYDVGKPTFMQTVKLISSIKPERYVFTSSTKSASSDSPKGKGADNLDDFRLREEQKEEEFRKQQEQPPNEKQDPSQQEQQTRQKILDAALAYVSEHGWSKKALALGAEAAGYSSVAHGMFPGGSIELIRHFNAKSNDELLVYLKEKTNNGELKIDKPAEFLIDATKKRLQMLEPYISHWPQAIAIMSMPQNVPTSLAQLLTLVDDICYYAGDRSVNFKWYTRRVGLATIYKVTEMFMLQDSSIDHQETWKFLRHRMEEACYVEEILGQSEGLSQNMQKGFASVFTTARNILGLGYYNR